MMDVIIVDDEAAGRRTLREYCEAERDLRVVGEFGDGTAALAAVRLQKPQLLFLDIQMDPLNGIDLARALEPTQLPSLVFVTAYDTYALEAFEVCAVDYLLKPFDQERFRKTLARVRPRHLNSGADERQTLLAGLLAQLERGARGTGEEKPRLLAELGGHLHVLDVTQVEMIEADRNYVVIRVGKENFHARSTLQQAEVALRSQPMLRISRVPGESELRQGSEPHVARRFHFGAGGRRYGHQQRRVSPQGEGILEHPADFVLEDLVRRKRRENFQPGAFGPAGRGIRVPDFLRAAIAAHPFDTAVLI
jgi:two-component system, LytTR family, response regulator